MNWVATLLDDLLARRAKIVLSGTSKSVLSRQAYSIAAHIATRSDCTPATKNSSFRSNWCQPWSV